MLVEVRDRRDLLGQRRGGMGGVGVGAEDGCGAGEWATVGRRNGRLWSRLARALEVVAGRPVLRLPPPECTPPRATGRSPRRRRGRARALPKEGALCGHHAAARCAAARPRRHGRRWHRRSAWGRGRPWPCTRRAPRGTLAPGPGCCRRHCLNGQGGGIGSFGVGWLEHPRRWLGARWADSPPGTAHRPELPGAPLGGAGGELGRFDRAALPCSTEPLGSGIIRSWGRSTQWSQGPSRATSEASCSMERVVLSASQKEGWHIASTTVVPSGCSTNA